MRHQPLHLGARGSWCVLIKFLPPFQPHISDVIHTHFAGSLNCAAYVAGIIEGALSAADFPSTVIAHFHTRPYCLHSSYSLQVTAHNLPVAGGVDKTVFLIKFHAAVIAREASLSKSQ